MQRCQINPINLIRINFTGISSNVTFILMSKIGETLSKRWKLFLQFYSARKSSNLSFLQP